MENWMIVLIVYVAGALITFLLTRKLNTEWYVKAGVIATWPASLILYVIHRIHNGL